MPKWTFFFSVHLEVHLWPSCSKKWVFSPQLTYNTVQLTSVKLDTFIRLTHRKVSLELIYHSYNCKHQQHIILYIGHIITKYQNINFTYQKNAYFILKPKTSLYQNFASFKVLFIQKHKKYHCLKQIHTSSREIGH